MTELSECGYSAEAQIRQRESEEVMARAENSGKPWTADEDDRLRQLVLSGAAIDQIVEGLDRTESSVRARAHLLGVTLRRFGSKRRGLSRWG